MSGIAQDLAIAPSGNWQPSNQGLLAWDYDIATTNNANTAPPIGGALNYVRLYTPVPISVTNILLIVLVGGSSLTSGQNFAALYDTNNNLLGQTADQSTTWNSTGLKTMALSGGPYSVGPGYFYVAFWVNSSGAAPGILRMASSAAAEINVGLGSSTYRFANGNTATTAAPSSVSLVSPNGTGYWVGLN